MEKLSSILSQYINPDRLQTAVPEYLWFVIAVVMGGGVIYVLHRLVNYLMSAVSELREANAENSKSIALLQQMFQSLKEIVADHDQYIRNNPQPKRNRGQ